jgi:hypothetical protein
MHGIANDNTARRGFLWLIRKATQLDLFGRPSGEGKRPKGRQNHGMAGQIHLPTNRPPGGGWQPIPASKHGGFRRRRGSKWEYWYPDGQHGTHETPREPTHGHAHPTTANGDGASVDYARAGGKQLRELAEGGDKAAEAEMVRRREKRAADGKAPVGEAGRPVVVPVAEAVDGPEPEPAEKPKAKPRRAAEPDAGHTPTHAREYVDSLGIEYALYTMADGRWAVRAYDRDAGETYAIHVYPTKDRAVAEFEKTVAAARKSDGEDVAPPAAPVADEAVPDAPAAPTQSQSRDEVLANRGEDGLSVTSQTEKDARDWGEKIGGARKDRYDDISSRKLEELESEGGDVAFRAVTKDRVLGKHDPDYDRDLGLSPGASLIKRSLWRQVAPRPENTAGHRENYVAAAEWLRKMMDTKKTAGDAAEFLRDWQDTVRYQRTKGGAIPVDDFIKMVGAVPDTPENRRSLVTSGSAAQVFAADGSSFIYAREKSKAIGITWAEQSTHKRELTPAESAERVRLLRVWNDMPGAGWGSPENEAKSAAYSAQLKITESMQHGALVQTYEHGPDVDRLTRYSKALGHKFDTQLLNKTKGARSASIWQDVHAATRHDEDGGGWDPLAPKTGTGGGDAKAPKSSHSFKAGVEEAERVGPKVAGDVSEAALTRDFGMRAGEFGRSVNDATGDAHVQKSYEALADLAEVLGLERKQLSHGGQLAIAFGARGRGGAKAHYESDKKVINITKNAAGSLAHEWGHFLDHIASAEGLVSAGGNKLRATFSSHDEHADSLPPEVRQAFAGVMSAIKYGEGAAAGERIQRANKGYEDVRTRPGSGYGGRRSPEHAGELAAAVREIRDAHAAAAGLKQSEFMEHAAHLGGYWERPHEMFARAFEAFVEDEIAAKGRKSEYLVSGTAERLRIIRAKKVGNAKVAKEVEIYPHGADRTAINKSMRKLFDAMKTSGYLRKALAAVGRHGFAALIRKAAGQ